MPLDFDSGRCRIRENVKLLHTYAREFDAGIDEAGFGDALGESFNQKYMAGSDDFSHRVCHGFVIDHAGQAIPANRREGEAAGAEILDPEVDVHPDPLGRIMFVRMHADAGGQHHIAQEHVPQLAGGAGDTDMFHAVRAFWVMAEAAGRDGGLL